jgi:hypothetical protein
MPLPRSFTFPHAHSFYKYFVPTGLANANFHHLAYTFVHALRSTADGPSALSAQADFLVRLSSSSRVRGQSLPKRRERARSASSFPPVWQWGQ